VTPDLVALIGEEGTPEENERLRRVHELLVAAGPPPALPASLAYAPEQLGHLLPLRRHRFQATLAAAAAAVAVAFGAGYLLGNHGSGFSSKYAVGMHGIGDAAGASAKIQIAAADAEGNWPLLLRIQGLKPLPNGGWYELYLTKNGKLAGLCGPFKTGTGATVVHMSVPYHLGRDVGWVVVARIPGQRHVPVLLTT
jgi:hypothetical protein